MRPSKDTWAMRVSLETSLRSTCARRAVGCVLLNDRGHILATGYNGVAAGLPHCAEGDHVCPGVGAPSGTQLDGCHAIHAEQNALLQCRDVYAIDTCYVTCSPCMTCTKLLLNTSTRRIVFAEQYPDSGARDLWVQVAGRVWQKVPHPVLYRPATE